MERMAVRMAVLAASIASSSSAAQVGADCAQSAVVSGQVHYRSHHDSMRLVNDRFPHFGGFYLGERGQGLHINVTGPSDLQAIADLLAKLIGRGEWAGWSVQAQEVRYTFRALLDMLFSEQARALRTHSHTMMYGIDDRNNRLYFWFYEGISEGDVRNLIEASGLAADAVSFRWGGRSE
jgi:hypothetical protein